MILVETEDQFHAALDVLRKAGTIAIDTETYGVLGEPVKHPAQGNRLIGISTYCTFPDSPNYTVNFYFPFRHNYDEKHLNLFTVSENLPIDLLPKFAEVLGRPDVKLDMWHKKFDMQMFRADGLEINPEVLVEDGMVKAQLIDETMSHRLKDVGSLVFGKQVAQEEANIKAIIKKQKGYHKTSPRQMAPYACKDAELTYNLKPYLDRELERQKLTPLVRREMKFQDCLMEMEWEGIRFDKELASELATRSRKRMRALEDQLGFDPNKRNQLAHVLFAKHKLESGRLPHNVELTETKSKEFPFGMPKMDEQVLVGLRDPIADQVLEYRGLGKANSTWYQGWLDRLGLDGRLHPTYNHSDKREKHGKYGTVTSRLSSFIQQMPRDPDAMVKLLLMPEVEQIMVELDYRQIEYREAACYSQDPILLEQFRYDEDTHQHLADQIGVDRQSAKQTAYTILYGGQGHALAINLMKQVWQNEKRIVTITDEEGQEIVNAYYRVHPKIKQVSDEAKWQAKRLGYVTLWNGRKRHFKKTEPWTYRKAFNSVLQGGAAQIICESMLQFDRLRPVAPFRMRLQVHDSLWFTMPEKNFDDHVAQATEVMEWPSKKFPVPFPVDFKVIRGEALREDQLRGELLGTGPR